MRYPESGRPRISVLTTFGPARPCQVAHPATISEPRAHARAKRRVAVGPGRICASRARIPQARGARSKIVPTQKDDPHERRRNEPRQAAHEQKLEHTQGKKRGEKQEKSRQPASPCRGQCARRARRDQAVPNQKVRESGHQHRTDHVQHRFLRRGGHGVHILVRGTPQQRSPSSDESGVVGVDVIG